MHESYIDYLTHTWPIVTGCLHTMKECPTMNKCWARSMHHRFAEKWTHHYNLDFSPKFNEFELQAPFELPRTQSIRYRIGVGFTGDLFGDWVPFEQQSRIIEVVRQCHWHYFLFLTKASHNLPQHNPWPDNAWVGASLTGRENIDGVKSVLDNLARVEADIVWLSYEPILAPIDINNAVNWLVMGGQSGRSPIIPNRSWIELAEIQAIALGIPVFQKVNLPYMRYREYPVGVKI